MNSHFEAVVEAFLREREAGRTPDPQRYLDSFPNLAPALRDYFAGQDLFDRLAPDLAPAAQTRPVAATIPLPVPGERVGGFELIDEVGRGGMGIVYRARQTKLDRVVALKMIRRGQADDAELARFRAEAEAIARLQHPNIVQVFEVGEHDGMPFFALEYCAGGSLEERLRGTTLLPAQAAAVVAGLARAMQAAHQQHVVHRDLKPANVLLAGGNGAAPLDRLTPKVSDFGLARKLDDPGLTQSGVIVGTPSYMAPEQARGRSKEVGPAADVYALGAVLYECLTGRPPFRAATPLDTLLQVIHSDPVPPRQLNPAVPRDLETICLKCLHKEPHRRYAHTAALADDLGRYLDGRPVLARRAGRAERLLRWARRRPAAAGLAAALVLLVAGACVAGWWYQQHQLEETARQARDDARNEYVTQEVTAALDKGKHELKELQQALGRLLPDETHPLSVSVLLSDPNQWQTRLQAARTLYLQAKKLGDSNPDALAAEQKAGLELLGTQVTQAETHFQIAQQLDAIRLEAWTIVDGKFDIGQTRSRYEKVFLEQLHLDMRNGPLPRLVDRTKGSDLRFVLAAALDHWADVTADKDLRLRLLEVARLADPDPWRDQVRNLSTWQNLPKMRELASAVRPARQTPQALFLLQRRLCDKGARQEAVALLRLALVHHPADFWLNFDLGFRTDDLGEQLGCYRAALSIRPRSALAYNNLGWALRQKKDTAGSIACFLKALELDPNYTLAHNNLNGLLRAKGNLDAALQGFRQARKLHPKLAPAFINLGHALHDKKDRDRALACYQMALACDPGCAMAHYNLAIALRDTGNLEGAIQEFKKTIDLDPNYLWARLNLGCALLDKGDKDGAVTCFNEALRWDPKYAPTHFNLANALEAKKDFKAAVASYRDAIAWDPNYAEAHCNLGQTLRNLGQFADALKELKLGHQLGSARPGWPNSEKQWIKTCEELLAQDQKVVAIQQGKARPASAAEQIALGYLCAHYKKQYAAAVIFYAGAFAAPDLAADLTSSHRYHAACAAALAAAGMGEDAGKLDAPAKTKLRQQALSWLQADLQHWQQHAKSGQPAAQQTLLKNLSHWQTDADLAGVCDAKALAQLPDGERQYWQKLWADVARLLQTSKE
jgi:serine/threonine-protein kinase